VLSWSKPPREPFTVHHVSLAARVPAKAYEETEMRTLILCLSIGSALAAAPAFAQYPYPDRSRTGRVADEIARTVEDTAQAVGRVRDSLDRSLYDVRFRGPERFAIDRCRPQVERYGQMHVDEVRPYKRRSFRVYGRTEAYGGGYYDRYRSRAYAPRSFTCTVREDGRVKVKTRRLRY
jgi:hypothetical protein